jgi:tetratricopeptide (TPR) repeat protein
MRRLIGAKQTSVRHSSADIRRLAFEYFLGDQAGGISLFFPMEWSRRRSDDPMAAYLVGRRLWQHRQWAMAEQYLAGLPDRLERPALVGEARRMLGRTLYARGEFERATRQFQEARRSAIPKYRAEANEWLRRIDWKRNQAEEGRSAVEE